MTRWLGWSRGLWKSQKTTSDLNSREGGASDLNWWTWWIDVIELIESSTWSEVIDLIRWSRRLWKSQMKWNNGPIPMIGDRSDSRRNLWQNNLCGFRILRSHIVWRWDERSLQCDRDQFWWLSTSINGWRTYHGQSCPYLAHGPEKRDCSPVIHCDHYSIFILIVSSWFALKTLWDDWWGPT
jgi:hypothetical protein